MTYEQLQKANATIKTTNIKGKEYSEVSQRIKVFRMLYPEGFITTEIVSHVDGVVIMTAKVGYYDGDRAIVLGTGTAYEKEGSSNINRTSYIENCETSACGRALGMMGIGSDAAIASVEEVQNAIHQQEEVKREVKKATPEQIRIMSTAYPGEMAKQVLDWAKVDSWEEMPMATASAVIKRIQEREARK